MSYHLYSTVYPGTPYRSDDQIQPKQVVSIICSTWRYKIRLRKVSNFL